VALRPGRLRLPRCGNL